MQALGTRCVVPPQAQRTALSVLDGAVRVMPDKANESIVVRAGEQTRFSASDIESIQTAPAHVDAWSQGVLYAQNMRLEAFLAELARYRSGVLHCDQSVADLRVSGAFQLRDTDRILALLAQTLPVQIRTRTRLWVTVSNRPWTCEALFCGNLAGEMNSPVMFMEDDHSLTDTRIQRHARTTQRRTTTLA